MAARRRMAQLWLYMKPLPPPRIRGNTDWERFDNAVGVLLNAPKQAFVKQEAKAGEEAGRAEASLTALACHADLSLARFVLVSQVIYYPN